MIELDWDDLTRSAAHLRIEADSIDTGRYPEILFHSAAIRQKGGALFEIEGSLRLHGVIRPVVLEAEYGGQASDLSGIARVGVLGRGAVDRRQFGLTWNRPLAPGGVMVGWEVRREIRTSGGEGMSLVKGVQVRLKAIGLSVKPGANIGAIHVGGQIETVGADVESVEIDGKLGELQVRGGIAARGPRSDAVHVRGDIPGLGAVALTAVDGQALVRTPG